MPEFTGTLKSVADLILGPVEGVWSYGKVIETPAGSGVYKPSFEGDINGIGWSIPPRAVSPLLEIATGGRIAIHSLVPTRPGYFRFRGSYVHPDPVDTSALLIAIDLVEDGGMGDQAEQLRELVYRAYPSCRPVPNYRKLIYGTWPNPPHSGA